MRVAAVALILLAQSATTIFRFEMDGFWLNLHHFLYVLGRVEAKMPDIKREAVADALDRAAPIYRKAWWPRHREANRKWLQSMQEPLQKYGPPILAFVTRRYQEPW